MTGHNQKPMMWVDIIKVRSKCYRRALTVAKRQCALPLQRSRGAFLQVLDEKGRQLVGSTDICFPMCGKDWQAMKGVVKVKYPKAHTLQMLTIIDSAHGTRAFDAGDYKPNTGAAYETVHRYSDAGESSDLGEAAA